ncbi:MAG: hypothetical protein ACU84Q_06715 [Gammaproteobacteria bacterium]
MTIGKEIGTFSADGMSISVSQDSDGGRVFEISDERTVSGGWNEAVLSTMVARTYGFQTRAYTSEVVAYLDNGETPSRQVPGVLKGLGNHKWQINGVDLVSDGSRISAEGVMSLADRNLKGTWSVISS